MTIDEAIKHCKEVVAKCGQTQCALDHQQLAEWLTELKILRMGSLILTDKQRRDYVSGKFFRCIKSVDTVRKGSGCNVGEHYWFEYVHDTNDGENPNADAFYRKLSDNNHYDEVYISDDELMNNFEVVS